MSFAIPAVGQELQRFSCFDFSGGLDVSTAQTKLAMLGSRNKWLTVATNVIFEDDGSVEKRWGMRQASALVNSTAPFLGGTRYYLSSGTAYNVIAHANGNVYRINAGGTALTSIKSGLTAQFKPYTFAVYNDTLFIANGVDVPQQWDGTTFSALGGSSPNTSKVIVAHGNRLFATATAVPSRLYWSKLNNPTDWSGTSDAGFMDVQPNDNTQLRSLVSGNQELVLLKTGRPYRLQGIGPTTGYTIVDNLLPASGSVGATSSIAGQWASNQVFYVSQMGVHALIATQNYGDLQEAFISQRVEPYFRQNTSYSPYDTVSFQEYDLLDAPALFYDTRNNLLMCAQRKQGGSNYWDRLLVFDTNLKAWSEWNFAGDQSVSVNNFSAMYASEEDSTHVPEMRLALYNTQAPTGGSAGWAALRRDQTSDQQIDTAGGGMEAAPISAQIRHITNLGAPGIEKSVRFLWLFFRKESSTTTITVNLYVDQQTTAAFTTTVDITSSTAETLVIKRINVGPGVLGDLLEVDIQQATAGKSFRFYGYHVDYRPRRRIRRGE